MEGPVPTSKNSQPQRAEHRGLRWVTQPSCAWHLPMAHKRHDSEAELELTFMGRLPWGWAPRHLMFGISFRPLLPPALHR